MNALFAAAIAACLVVLGFACRDAEELNEQEYFSRLQAISDSADAKFQPLVDQLNMGHRSEAEEIKARRDFFEGDLAIFREVEQELRDLQPPDSVRSAHGEYIAALAHLGDVIAGLTERMGEAQSLVELEELLADPELQQATDRFDNACVELEGLASRSNIALDLDCEGPGAVWRHGR